MEIQDLQNSEKKASALWVYYVFIFLIVGGMVGYMSFLGISMRTPTHPYEGSIPRVLENTNSGSSMSVSQMNGSNKSEQGTGMNLLGIRGYQIDSIWDFVFLHPRALAIDTQDNIYVGESYQGPGTHARVLKFSASGSLIGWWGKGNRTSGWHDALTDEIPAGNGDNPGEFNYIFKITFDILGNMYVIDRGTYYDERGNLHQASQDRIAQYDKSGNFLGWFYGYTPAWTGKSEAIQSFSDSGNTLLNDPSCIILRGEDMIIGNWNKHRIDVYDRTTGELIQWLGKNQEGKYGWHTEDTKAVSAPYFGSEIGAFNGIIDCNIYGNKLDIVSYNSNPVVAEYNWNEGTYARGLSHNDGHKPQEIIEDAYGNLIMSDNYEGSIKFFDQDLRLITKMQLGPGGDYFGVGDFAFDSKGKLYFIEQQKQKLYVLQLEYSE